MKDSPQVPSSKNLSLYPMLQWAQLPLAQAVQPPPPAMGELEPSAALLKEAKREMALRARPWQRGHSASALEEPMGLRSSNLLRQATHRYS